MLIRILIEDARRDLMHAARLLRRNPAFALTAALSLAIGIGANTTIFTVANALLFQSAPGVTDAGRLVDIVGFEEGRSSLFFQSSYPTYLDLQRRATMLDGVYGYGLAPRPMSMAGSGAAERIYGNVVTTNFFSVLGVRPAAGRLFTAADADRPGANAIVVLSHSFWRRRFDRDPGVVGRTLQLNGQMFTIIGVAAEGFQGTNIAATDIWAPVHTADVVMQMRGAAGASLLTERGGPGFLIIGARLKAGVSVRQAAIEMDAIGRALERDYPGDYAGRRLRLAPASPIPEVARAPVAAFLALLIAIVSIVLAIACANVAAVLLARATARRKEIAVRLAMGAGRGRLVRQLLTETVVLFALGGGAGLLLARGMTSLVASLVPALPIPVDVALALDRRAALFTSGLSMIAALASGVAPALHASRAEVVSAIKDNTDSPSGGSYLRNAFVIGQVAFSILLVVGAGLLLRALERAGSIDPGFDPRGVELTTLDLSLAGYTAETGPTFARELVERVRALRGVQAATVAALVPMGSGTVGAMRLGGITVPGVPPPPGQSSFQASWNVVEPNYFATLRIPLIAGRDFAASDREGAERVAILGEATARRFWPGKRNDEAVGQFLTWQLASDSRVTRRLRVIGVARDVKYLNLREESPPLFVYVPLQQQYPRELTLVTRSVHGGRIAGEIRSTLSALNPNLPIVSARTLEDGMALTLVPQRVGAAVSGSLGFVGLLLAAIGIYGVTAYAVTLRTREIGIRVALGATRGDITRMVLRQGMSLAAIGSAIGLVLALSASRLLRTLLFGITPFDPLTFAGAAALFAAVGLIACLVPARRATSVGPSTALRYE